MCAVCFPLDEPCGTSYAHVGRQWVDLLTKCSIRKLPQSFESIQTSKPKCTCQMLKNDLEGIPQWEWPVNWYICSPRPFWTLQDVQVSERSWLEKTICYAGSTWDSLFWQASRYDSSWTSCLWRISSCSGGSWRRFCFERDSKKNHLCWSVFDRSNSPHIFEFKTKDFNFLNGSEFKCRLAFETISMSAASNASSSSFSRHCLPSLQFLSISLWCLLGLTLRYVERSFLLASVLPSDRHLSWFLYSGFPFPKRLLSRFPAPLECHLQLELEPYPHLELMLSGSLSGLIQQWFAISWLDRRSFLTIWSVFQLPGHMWLVLSEALPLEPALWPPTSWAAFLVR